MLQVLVVPVAAFYLLRDFERIDDFVYGWVPVPYRDSFKSRLLEIDVILSNFLKGQLTVCAMLAVLYTLGLTLSGTPMSVVIGVGAGLASLVPYLGLLVGLVPALVLTALAHASLGPLVGVVATFAVAQALEGYLITPKIVGEKVGLHPVAIMLSLLVGGSLFGFFGLVFAVPAACVLKVLLAALKESYQESAYFGDHQREDKSDEQEG
jgi:predicted PurR-regulated permease PerM